MSTAQEYMDKEAGILSTAKRFAKGDFRTGTVEARRKKWKKAGGTYGTKNTKPKKNSGSIEASYEKWKKNGKDFR